VIAEILKNKARPSSRHTFILGRTIPQPQVIEKLRNGKRRSGAAAGRRTGRNVALKKDLTTLTLEGMPYEDAMVRDRDARDDRPNPTSFNRRRSVGCDWSCVGYSKSSASSISSRSELRAPVYALIPKCALSRENLDSRMFDKNRTNDKMRITF
jgi:hypothetical protein